MPEEPIPGVLLTSRDNVFHPLQAIVDLMTMQEKKGRNTKNLAVEGPVRV